jgi:hypothetical protein
MDAARYLELRRAGRNVLVHERDGATGLLSVPHETPLPTLHERVAAMCSGLAPTDGATDSTYENVSPEIARLLARSLGQRLTDAKGRAI